MFAVQINDTHWIRKNPQYGVAPILFTTLIENAQKWQLRGHAEELAKLVSNDVEKVEVIDLDPRKVTFDINLFDDESVHEKLTVMSGWEAAWDDERNIIPEEYYEIVDLKPGETLRITVQKV